ncbi:hypothetical protein H112_07439 [Trichophyton rubrum D6]|uniref:Uncharacterized protein n=2 Tax=Trichophyton TaxID=5550 RepID=A0A022VSC6_TRIRU|nr:hypothetical protein H100_07465 [Trichophyton rubrum MR850]EZF38262.1 hypothetical protein H102_07428 [Trichophyton rubrum CBS 100081]EZF49000.1 hypothetical protein H103_07452 [Trichophyton rubrum CBS 288.86]EZF59635.1 hypothetical protein H104_07400 [Trichophyton rubrum CBS 289.86]EZF70165.1 hypothetical protein H105_07459 [Trichophyton soudanense CBS 452.61]EZF80901.1 hypothetical protein H110_07447 [Trichophyton rubrum MR1448]EZF91568.1 hypothetical protein H113_07507 [Trichophyton rub
MSVLPIIAKVIPLLAQRLGIKRLSCLCLCERSRLFLFVGKRERCTVDSHPSGAVGLNQAAFPGLRRRRRRRGRKREQDEASSVGGNERKESENEQERDRERGRRHPRDKKNRTGRLPEGMWSCAGRQKLSKGPKSVSGQGSCQVCRQ